MWLSKRNSEILSCLVKLYTSTNRPVSSEKLAETIGLSSSSIRKELQKMEKNGFVFKPGKSRGRVPSDKGLKHFIREMVKSCELTGARSNVPEIEGSDFNDVSRNLLTHLSEQTSNPGFVFLNSIFDLNFLKIRLCRVAPHKVMAVIRSICYFNFSKIFTTDNNYNETDLKQWEEILNKEFRGKTLNNTVRILRNRLSGNRERYRQIYKGLYYLLCNSNLLATELITRGSHNLLHSGNLSNSSIMNLMEKPELIEERERLSAFLNDMVTGSSREPMVALGKDTGIEEMKEVVLISSNYFFSEKPIGNLGIIGPKYMNYQQPLSSVGQYSAYFSEILSRRHTEA